MRKEIQPVIDSVFSFQDAKEMEAGTCWQDLAQVIERTCHLVTQAYRLQCLLLYGSRCLAQV
jgi:hypothetical protein